MSVKFESGAATMGPGGGITIQFTAPKTPTPTATYNGMAMTVTGDGSGNWTATMTGDLQPGTHAVELEVPGAGKTQTVTLEVSPPPP